MSQLLDINQTMQTSLNVIVQELQSIRHQMKYGNSHTTTAKDWYGPLTSIYAAPHTQQITPPPSYSQPPFVLPFPPQHMPPGTRPTMQCKLTLNGFHYLLDFMDTTPHRVAAVLCGRGCGHGNRTCNNNYGRYWGALLKMLYTCQQHVDNRPKCCKILTTL